MCKLIVKYLCCCFYLFEDSDEKNGQELEKVRNKKKGDNTLILDKKTDSSDSERYIKSSSENKMEIYESNKYREKGMTPKIQIRFNSPPNAKGDTSLEHRLRLLERGYDLQSETPIGQGVFSKVYPVIRKSDGQLMACKISMNRELCESTRLSRELCDEVFLIIHTIDTEPLTAHLIRYFAQFIYDAKYCYVVMELSDGETLHRRLSKSAQPFSESEARQYFISITQAINHLHASRIAHRNLKLENVLLFRSSDREVLKVSDYCTNRMATKTEKVVVYVRDAISITYMSPQILKFYAKHLRKVYKKDDSKIRPFDPFKGDIWALGVCLYYMVMKTPPYGFPPDTQSFDKIKAAKQKFKFVTQCLAKFEDGLDFASDVKSKTSNECIQILNLLLEPKSSRRIDHFGVVQHFWFRGVSEQN